MFIVTFLSHFFVFWGGNWTIMNKKVVLMGYCFHLWLLRVWIEFQSMILVVFKNRIWCIGQIVLFCMLFWWVGTNFCGRWGIIPGGSLVWIQSRLYIWVVVVWLLLYVILLVLRLGRWIAWCCLGPCRCVLFGFYESIGLA